MQFGYNLRLIADTIIVRRARAGGQSISIIREELKMSCNCNPNKSIKCTVTQCKNHCKDEDYCSLSNIMVGTHESNPTMIECTDCTSFELK